VIDHRYRQWRTAAGEGQGYRDDPLSRAFKTASHGKSGTIESGGKAVPQCLRTDRAVVIVGAVHISQALALARSCRLRCDGGRSAHGFASPERFPDVPLVAEWPDGRCRRSTSITIWLVAVTHDPEDRRSGTAACVRTRLLGIGAPAAKNDAKRAERLKAALMMPISRASG
jgi:xanthine dehydrogenase accessory factor